jgi:hypothetical protein
VRAELERPVARRGAPVGSVPLPLPTRPSGGAC